MYYRLLTNQCDMQYYPHQACVLPPLDIEKQKKVIRANFKLFHLYFATFLVGNIIFLKSKKKESLSDFRPPPLTNSWTRHCLTERQYIPANVVFN